MFSNKDALIFKTYLQCT